MKKLYSRTISCVLAILFVMLLYGLSQSAVFLDYQSGYYGADQAFAEVIFSNDIYLLSFTCISVVICIIYAVLEFFKVRHEEIIRFGLAILLMGIASYMFIILVGLRKQAFSIENFATNNAFVLYKEYRTFSLEISFSQFLLSLHALLRSFYHFYLHMKKKEEPSSEEEQNH